MVPTASLCHVCSSAAGRGRKQELDPGKEGCTCRCQAHLQIAAGVDGVLIG